MYSCIRPLGDRGIKSTLAFLDAEVLSHQVDSQNPAVRLSISLEIKDPSPWKLINLRETILTWERHQL
jgi:hypothetical protein